MNVDEWLNGSGELTDVQVNDEQVKVLLEQALTSPPHAWKALCSKKHRDAIRKLGIRERALRETVSKSVRDLGSRLSKLQSIDGFHATLLEVAASAVEIDTDSRRKSQFPFLMESDLKVLIEAGIANDQAPIVSKFDARKMLPKLLAEASLGQIRLHKAGKGAPNLPLLLGQCITRALEGRSPTVGGRLLLGVLMLKAEGIEADERDRLDRLGIAWEERQRIVDDEIPNGNFDFLLRESMVEDIELVLAEQEEICQMLGKVGLGIDVKLERRRRSIRDLAIRSEDPWVLWTHECLRGGDEALVRKAMEGLERIAQRKGLSLDWTNSAGLKNEALWQRVDHVPIWISEPRAGNILQEELEHNQAKVSATGWISFGILKLACVEGEVRALSCMQFFGLRGQELLKAREACGRGVDELLRGAASFDWIELARRFVEGGNVVTALKLPAAADTTIKDALCRAVSDERDSLADQLQNDGLSFFALHAYRCFERRVQGTSATESETHLIAALLDGDAESIRGLAGEALLAIAARDGSPEALRFLEDRLAVNEKKVLRQWELAGRNPKDLRAKLEQSRTAILDGKQPEGVMEKALLTGDASILIESTQEDNGTPEPPARPEPLLDRFLRTRILAGVLLAGSLLWMCFTYIGGAEAADEFVNAAAEPADTARGPSGLVGLRPLQGAAGLWYSDLVSGDQVTALLPVAVTGSAPATVDALTAARWCKLWGEVARSEIQSLVGSDSVPADWVVRLPNESELRLLAASGPPLAYGGNQGEWLSSNSSVPTQSHVGAWVQGAPRTLLWSAPRVGFRYVVARSAGARP